MTNRFYATGLLVALLSLTACEGELTQAFAWPSPPVSDAQTMRQAMKEKPAAARTETAAQDAAPAAKEEPMAQAAAETPASADPMLATLATVAVGSTVDVKGTSAEGESPKLTVLEEYDSATGERCRRFAWFAAETERGLIQTACRLEENGEWMALRSLSHETLSPLASLPSFNAAHHLQDMQ